MKDFELFKHVSLNGVKYEKSDFGAAGKKEKNIPWNSKSKK